MNNIKLWQILSGILTFLVIVLFIWCCFISSLLEDSTNNNLSLTKAYEDEMSNSARYKNLYEDIQQVIENGEYIPKQQYLDDIEYLENEIRKLRGE